MVNYRRNHQAVDRTPGLGHISPGFAEFSRLAQPGLLVPVWQEVVVDTETPVTAFRKIARDRGNFLLESVEGAETLGRYSFLGTKPFLTFSSRGNLICLEHLDGRTEEYEGDVVKEIKRLLAGYRSVAPNGCPPFSGGAVGCFGYEFARQLERLPGFRCPSEYPDVYLMFFDSLYAFDHLRRTMIFLVNARIGDNPEMAYQEAGQRVSQMVGEFLNGSSDALRKTQKFRAMPQPVTSVDHAKTSLEYPPGELNSLISNFTHSDFLQAIVRAKEHIFAGDIFQLVLSQRFQVPCQASSFDLYRSLRSINPSPYLFYLECGVYDLIGSSPEVHVRLAQGRAILRPIAGTRPRGRNAAEDRLLAEDLLGDPKERAEHVMLVDLARNDLGRVCEYGTVKVQDLMKVERYSHVMHLVSEVSGQLRKEEDGISLLAATFPAGTVSGAPKIRAMQLIAEIEPEARGLYAGAVGYLSFQGNLDTGIIIRTMVVQDKNVTFQAGAGIVADSDPEREYQETINKAQAMFKAIQRAEEKVLWF